MRLALALMFLDEAHWLRLHLPSMLPAVDGLIGLDGGSTDDSADVIRAFGGKVFERPFDWNFGAQAQALLDAVESEGYDAVLRLDPDEIITPEDIEIVRRELERGQYHLLLLPRIDFSFDRVSRSPDLDWPQWRAWLLHRGIRYHDFLVHETPKLPDGLLTWQMPVCIYHYGNLVDPYTRHWRGLTYKALIDKTPLPPFEPVPTPWYPTVPYHGTHPLDPEEIGLTAPFTDRPYRYHLDVNLLGDRAIEYGFVQLHIPAGRGRALDVGSGGIGTLSEAMQRAGWQVTALDQEEVAVPNGVTRLIGDVLTLDLPQYDLIVACSTVEHVGLAGRYGVTESVEDGDLLAMQKLRKALAPGGMLILTLPVGRDRVHSPMHRVYGERLEKLLEGFEVLSETYWLKRGGAWRVVGKQAALNSYSIAVSPTDWQGCVYGIGGLILC